MNLNDKKRPVSKYKAASQNVDKTSREYQQQLLSRSRGFFLTVILFTAINLVLLLTSKGTYFLFSASIPYYMTMMGYAMDGGVIGQSTLISLAVSAVVLVAYFLCWFLSASKPQWLTIGICIFAVDTAALVYVCLKLLESPLDGIADLLIHGLLIWEMSKGITAAKNLKDMPETLR